MKRIHKLLFFALLFTAFLTAFVSAWDAPAGEWFSPYVAKAAENGILTYEGDTYVPNTAVTNKQVCLAAEKTAALAGLSYTTEITDEVAASQPATRLFAAEIFAEICSAMPMSPALNTVSFLPDVSVFSRSYDAVLFLYNLGILTGNDGLGSFSPDANITCEELAALACRTLDPSLRVNLSLPAGVSATEALEAFDGEKTDADNTVYATADDSFAITESLHRYATFDADEETAAEALHSIASVEKMLRLFDFRLSDAVFSTVADDFDGVWAAVKPLIDENAYGISEYAYYQNYLFTNYYAMMYSDFLQNTAPTPHELYQLYAGDYALVKHIFVTYDTSSAEEKEQAYNKMLFIKQLIANGSDFDALVSEYGEDPGMAAFPNGYLFTAGELVPEFEKAAFALKEGEISDIVETSLGYHILYRLPLTEDVFCSDDDLMASLAYFTVSGDFDSLLSQIYASTTITEVSSAQ